MIVLISKTEVRAHPAEIKRIICFVSFEGAFRVLLLAAVDRSSAVTLIQTQLCVRAALLSLMIALGRTRRGP